MKNYRKALDDIRKDIVQDIRTILTDNGFYELYIMDVHEGDSPIVIEGAYDGYNEAYTLDKIMLWPDGLRFDASSSYDNATLCENEVPSDNLLEILEWLDDHYDDIVELSKQ